MTVTNNPEGDGMVNTRNASFTGVMLAGGLAVVLAGNRDPIYTCSAVFGFLALFFWVLAAKMYFDGAYILQRGDFFSGSPAEVVTAAENGKRFRFWVRVYMFSGLFALLSGVGLYYLLTAFN